MLWFLFLKKNCSLNDIKLSLRYLKKFYIQVRTLIDWKINSKDVRCIRENFLFLFDSLKKFQIDPFIDTISNLSLYVNWNAKKEEQMYVIMLIYSKSGSVITALLLPPPNIDEDVPSTD
jgi:E3 ubiquitin-protein ligase DOA10